MKRWVSFFVFLFLSLSVHAQNYLGIFEIGEVVPFTITAADPITGSPTDPVNLTFFVLRDGATVSSGSMAAVQLGLATGTYSTDSDTPGNYSILISGLIGGVTAQTHKTYSLAASGGGISGIASKVAVLDGTPLTESTFNPIQTGIVHSVTSEVIAEIESASGTLSIKLDDVFQESQIASRELSRARLWYAQSTIDNATRQVPADLPSHMEVQVASPADIQFATPLETFYRIYYYPNASTATKASREIRSSTPLLDGTFYLAPDTSW